eukprot:746193-Hanusia_phi.AAC.6
MAGDKKKSHRARQAGSKANKKKAKKERREGKTLAKGQNPKAFGRSSAGITARIQQARKAEIHEKKLHVPLTDRSYLAEDPPPIVVAVVVRTSQGGQDDIDPIPCQALHTAQPQPSAGAGHAGVGQEQEADYHRMRQRPCLDDGRGKVGGPDPPHGGWQVCLLAERVATELTFCVISFGFEMETFEFLNILQAHGFPKILGILTHLDHFRDNKKLRKTKKRMKSVRLPPWLPFTPDLPSFLLSASGRRCMMVQSCSTSAGWRRAGGEKRGGGRGRSGGCLLVLHFEMKRHESFSDTSRLIFHANGNIPQDRGSQPGEVHFRSEVPSADLEKPSPVRTNSRPPPLAYYSSSSSSSSSSKKMQGHPQ